MRRARAVFNIVRRQGLGGLISTVRMHLKQYGRKSGNRIRRLNPALSNRNEVVETLQTLYSSIDEYPSITLLDIGAREATHITGRFKPLHDLGVLNVIGLEPDEDECQRLSRHYPEYEFYTTALAGKDTSTNFYETRAPGRASLHKPDISTVDRFRGDTTPFTVDQQSTATVSTLDTFVDEHGIEDIDFVKSDTQGSEYGIINGGEKTISSSVLGAELEVHFNQLYEGQGIFHQVDSAMRSHDFYLVDLRYVRLGRRFDWPWGDVSSNEEYVDGETIEGDALYILNPDKNELDRKTVLKLTVLCLLYGKISHIDHLLEIQDILSPQEVDSIRAAIAGRDSNYRPS